MQPPILPVVVAVEGQELTPEQQRVRDDFLETINQFPRDFDTIHVTYVKAGKHQRSQNYPIQEFINSVTSWISFKQVDYFCCKEWHMMTTLMHGTEMYCYVREYYDPGMGYNDETRDLDATISSDPAILKEKEKPKPSARQQRRNAH